MITEAIQLLADKRDLDFQQAEASIYEIMEGTVSEARTAAFLTAMKLKGETPEEIAGAAAGMRAHARPVEYPGQLLEIVGTGGDGARSFNISTTSAFVIAAGGVKVSKHGNRAASSRCGAADVLEALGANIRQEPETCTRLLDTVGMCFFFAPLYHQAMKYVGPVRKELGIRTIFNILGPLTNPAHAAYDCIGVYDASLVEPIAEVLDRLGTKRALVFTERTGWMRSPRRRKRRYVSSMKEKTEVYPDAGGFRTDPRQEGGSRRRRCSGKRSHHGGGTGGPPGRRV